MAVILNIETATQVCSVALSMDGEVVRIMESSEKNVHSSVITVFIDEIIKNAGIPFSALDAVAVSKGPGSYTGLRIGVSTAKGICYALDKPLVAIGTLESMAAGIRESVTGGEMSSAPNFNHEMSSKSDLFCPMIDARRMEVYSALFDQDLHLMRKTEAEIIAAESFSEFLGNHIIWFAGDGAEKCRPLLEGHPNARFIPGFLISAAHMVKLAESKFSRSEFENNAYFEPFYLKDFIPGIPRVKGL